MHGELLRLGFQVSEATVRRILRSHGFLRKPFDVFRLQVGYDKTTRTATCAVTLASETVDIAGVLSEEAQQKPNGHLTVPVRVVPSAGDQANGHRNELREGKTAVVVTDDVQLRFGT
ncbi:hypothetical protein [Nonomuraea fuscirosea]|uniref:hypothetical protein n=1 Tax=Nonomuraea fuscirosea TaxID=1291556 RepID=UPI00343E121F